MQKSRIAAGVKNTVLIATAVFFLYGCKSADFQARRAKPAQVNERYIEERKSHAEHCFNTQHYSKAIRDYRILAVAEPDSVEWQHSLANAYRLKKDYKKALHYYSIVIRKDSLESMNYIFRGKVLEHLGMIEAAFDDYSNAIRLGTQKFETDSSRFLPYCIFAYNSRADAYQRMGNTLNAIEDYSQSISLAKKSGGYGVLVSVWLYNALSLRASWHVSRKDYQKALADYTDLVTFDESARSRYERGRVYFLMGDVLSAEQDFRKAVKMNSKYAKKPYK